MLCSYGPRLQDSLISSLSSFFSAWETVSCCFLCPHLLHSLSLMLSDSGVMLLRKWSVSELYLTTALWFVIHSLKDKIFYGYLRIFDSVLKTKKQKEKSVQPAGLGQTAVSVFHTAPRPLSRTLNPQQLLSRGSSLFVTELAHFYFYFVTQGEVKANKSQILGDVTNFFFCVWSDATSPLRRLLGWAWVEPLPVLQGQVRLQTKKIFEFIASVRDFFF